METLYDILEVSRKASKEVIEKAYKTLAKKYHPDVQSDENKKYAEEMMKKINEAYSVLSDEQKKKEYDAKLEKEDSLKSQVNINPNNNGSSNNVNNQTYYNGEYNNSSNSSNNNSSYYQNYKYNSEPVNTNYSTDFENWRQAYSGLSRREQAKLRKKIEKEANSEFRHIYESYFKSLGYKLKHKWTFKDFVTLLIIIAVLALIFLILWWIPSTHEWMLQFYNNNLVIRIIVNIFIGIYKGIVQFFKTIWNN